MAEGPIDKRAGDEPGWADAERELVDAITQLPAEDRLLVPTDADGKPRVEIVHALYRYESAQPGMVKWIEVRELSRTEWKAVEAAHREVCRFTRGLDRYPAFAWGDLSAARDELRRQVREHTRPNEWMPHLIEYRILAFSTALRLYQDYATTRASRAGDKSLPSRAASIFSEVYDGSFAYRLMYSMRNVFHHGMHDLVTLHMTARFAEGSETERESEVHAYLNKSAFAASRANAAVRTQVRETTDDIDLFEFSERAFTDLRDAHLRIGPLLHPAAPEAAKLLAGYIEEIGGDRAHFHEYVRGLPTKGLLGTTTLDRAGFDYVARQAGKRATFEDGEPADPLTVLPTYPLADPSASST
ncbi:hypothetical protein OEB99_12390 [Actinotalea sp. M2MS4P-6]|uniref:hypothetical protein n=1 Tax=Actinotalea sp. M2MS4P-6 TaxID=2983762 RepID=UPI0021E3FEE0|nr:hypothetical protein [Actinotalea sp. M2MS4P-6]MCV2395107.1 hypothetical protein [Actinotalea sp. M2MS4P-6]